MHEPLEFLELPIRRGGMPWRRPLQCERWHCHADGMLWANRMIQRRAGVVCGCVSKSVCRKCAALGRSHACAARPCG
eukprot:2080389-Alexandrium_andersonii.AAC.1